MVTKKTKTLGLQKFTGVVQGATQRGDANVPIHLIDVNRQIRTQFDPERQDSINASIKAQGIHQPIIVLAKPDGRYDLIAGEYRYRGGLANDLKELPARIKHNLTDWEIRRIQVSENMERTDISTFDEAMGVAEDVEKFGFERAKEIWNRSDGWISKRTAVLKYAEPVRKLLEERKTEDLEVAHSLNQLHELAEQEYCRLEKRLRDGLPLSRDEARGKVQQVKQWLAESKQRETRRETLGRGSAKTKDAGATVTAGTATPAQASAAGTQAAPQPTAKGADVASSSQGNKTSHTPAQPQGAAGGAARISSEQELVLDQMVTLFQNGLASHGLIKDVQAELEALGADMNQTEWAMWSLYQTVALPLLAALGETRAQRYLQRTVADLRTAKPQELWSKLHPTTDGKASNDWSTTRVPVAPMPKDWRF